MKETLDIFGIGRKRLWFRFISASEGKYFAETVAEMVEKLKEMGPVNTKRLWEI